MYVGDLAAIPLRNRDSVVCRDVAFCSSASWPLAATRSHLDDPRCARRVDSNAWIGVRDGTNCSVFRRGGDCCCC